VAAIKPKGEIMGRTLKFWLAFLTLSFASVLSASAQDQSLTPVKIGTLKVASQADLWVAIQKGIFKKHGIDATLSFFNSGADSIPAMQGGAVDIALSIPGVAMIAIDKGIDIATVFQDETAHATPPDSASLQVLDSSPIRSLADLRGKKIAVGGLSTQNAIAVKMLLEKAGVDLSTVSFSEVPFPAMGNALKAGYVDAVNPIDPFTTQLRLTGGRVLSYDYVDAIPEMPVGVYWSKNAFIQANPKIIGAFVASMKEAIDYLHEDEKRARDEVADFIKMDRTILDQMPLIGWNYHIKLDKWQAVIEMVAHYTGIKPKPAAQYLTSQLDPLIVK
jgi:NitT/TauT family transport system substrate-binding protein